MAFEYKVKTRSEHEYDYDYVDSLIKTEGQIPKGRPMMVRSILIGSKGEGGMCDLLGILASDNTLLTNYWE